MLPRIPRSITSIVEQNVLERWMRELSGKMCKEEAMV
jgi:hypothetical protein